MSLLYTLAFAPSAPARRLPRWQQRQKNFDAAGPAAADGTRRASVASFHPSPMSPRELANLPALKSAQRAEFLRRARQLGHHFDALEQGLEEHRFFTATADALRLLPAAALQPHLVHGFHQPSPEDGGRGKGKALVFADGLLAAPGPRGPVHVQAISVDTKVLGPGEQWDVRPPDGDSWAPTGLPAHVVVNVRRLILHPGATVVVRSPTFSLLCQEYHCLAGPGPVAPQVAIRPVPRGAGLPSQLAELVFRDVRGPLAVHIQPAAHAPGRQVVLAAHVANPA